MRRFIISSLLASSLAGNSFAQFGPGPAPSTGGGGIAALTGDVSASGTGSQSATVNSVLGGQAPQTSLAPAPVSGNWYPEFGVTAATGNVVGAAGREACAPYVIVTKTTITIQALGVDITTAGTTTFAVAIKSNVGGFPSVPLIASGPVADTSTGDIAVTNLSPATVTLPSGTYYKCVQAGDATVIFDAASPVISTGAAMVGVPSLVDLNGGSLRAQYFASGQTVGTWSTLTPSAYTFGPSGNNAVPLLDMQSQ